jgi:predicted AlkP superfamily phosphohydrolase/phosphomutase
VKGALTAWLRDTTRWDFFLAVFGECHRAGHILWRDGHPANAHVPPGALLDVYRAVDTALGVVLAGIDLAATTVVVFALHGMGPNLGQDHFVRRVIDRINATERAPATQGGVVRALRDRVPARLQHAVARAVPVSVRDWVVAREVTGGLDWTRTPGLALRTDLHGFVRLNLIGRERDGILRPGTEETHRYVEHVTRAFMELRTSDTDAPVVRDVVAADDALPGARRDLMPDLIVRWADQYPRERLRSPELGILDAMPESGRTGEHRTQGFAIVLGAALRRDGLPPLAHNQDLRRFASHLLGVGAA